MKRRTFLTIGSTLAAGMALADPVKGLALPDTKIKAILFDAFPIFDPRPVSALVNKLYPEKGADLAREWKTRQFEYTWLRSMSNNYRDFLDITEDALAFATELLKLELSTANRKQLIDIYFQLPVWPEVPPVLAKMKEAGYRLGFLSNFTPDMLAANVKANNLAGYFEHQISVGDVKKYKPDPKTYAMGMDVFHLQKEEILFVAFAGWDAAGAKSFGYKTFWVNRLGLPLEKLEMVPDGSGKDLNDLMAFLK